MMEASLYGFDPETKSFIYTLDSLYRSFTTSGHSISTVIFEVTRSNDVTTVKTMDGFLLRTVDHPISHKELMGEFGRLWVVKPRLVQRLSDEALHVFIKEFTETGDDTTIFVKELEARTGV